MSIDLDLIKKEEELLKKQEEHLEELKLLNETSKNCKFDSSFIDEFLKKYEEELEKFVLSFIDEFLEKHEEELKEFKNLPSDEKLQILTERNSEKAE